MFIPTFCNLFVLVMSSKFSFSFLSLVLFPSISFIFSDWFRSTWVVAIAPQTLLMLRSYMKLRNLMHKTSCLLILKTFTMKKINNHSASKSGREVNRYGPKRIVHPSKHNASPSVNGKSSKYPVSTRMIQLHDAIITLSGDENFK